MKIFQRRIEQQESLTLGANTEDAAVKAANMYVVFVNAVTLVLDQAQTRQVASQDQVPVLPRVFLLDAKHLQATRQRIRDGDKSFAAAFAALERDAKEAMTTGPFSVINKSAAPPSGDKHDYMSQAPYWWPNPESTDGQPYIRRDGQRNPEINRVSDRQSIANMIDSVETLALAYYFTGNETYAVKATRLLRAWFLDSATRMNPNLQYGQSVPGMNTGRGYGLIETSGLTSVVDAIGLLAESKAWTEADQRGLEEWFDKFLQWMLESKNGREEADAKNNHGTYYDLQVASFALFVGKKDMAANVLKAVSTNRIARQIEPDGRQPLELARTKAWGYSTGNLRGLMLLARLAENVGVDLWNFQTPDGRSIRKALDYLIPFALGEQKWPYQQLGGWSARGLSSSLRIAAMKYQDQKYKAIVLKTRDLGPADRDRLLRPSITAKGPAQEPGSEEKMDIDIE
jgi:hypothetical protein